MVAAQGYFMKLSKIVTPAVIVAALALAPVPAFAQRGGGHGGGHSGGGARVGGGSYGARAAAVPRGGYYGGGYGRYGYGGYGYRGYGYGGYGRYGFGYGFGWGLAAPYYAFSPQFTLGFGLYAGYPVAYPYWAFPSPYIYGYPYPSTSGYGYPAAYPSTGDPAPNALTAAPGSGPTGQGQSEAVAQGQAPAQGQYGGLSFQITPATAQVLVDGVYVGTVGQFAPTTQPLTLSAGQHHVEIRADGGYQPITFDVNVAPGQVIPYQGTLQSQSAQGQAAR
jgi:hypothetical protein